MGKINSELVRLATGSALNMGTYDTLGVADADINGRVLTFIDDSRFIQKLNSNECIKGVLVNNENANLIKSGIDVIVVDDPRWFFFSIVNFLGKNKERLPNKISEKSFIHSKAIIADEGVVIEDDVVIEPGAIVLTDVIIRSGAVIRTGAVIGGDGFEHKKTSKGILSVVHDGIVIIEMNAEVGVNTFVAKGFAYRPTVVGEQSKIDALVHYAHGAQCGKRCLIVANAMIGGNVSIGDDAWIGPSAAIANRLTIGDRAFVTMGSIVTRNVSADEKVTGNFAIPHAIFLKNLKNSIAHD